MAFIVPSRNRGKDVTRWVDFRQRWAFTPAAAKTFGDTAIHQLFEHEGRMFVGYGDYGSNNGPTDLVSVGVDGDLITHLSEVPTEALFPYRLMRDGSLAVPWVDPKWYWGNGGFCTNSGGTWHSEEVPNMVHTFDVGQTSEGWWVCGARLNTNNSDVSHPVVLHRPFDSDTWTTAFLHPATDTFGRFYNLYLDGDSVSVYYNGMKYTYTPGSSDWVEWVETREKEPTEQTAFSATVTIGNHEYKGDIDGYIWRRLIV